MEITDNQRKVINMIENNLQIRFKGKTKEEATSFISENIERSKNASYEYLKNFQLLKIQELEDHEETEENYFDNGWYNMPH